MKCVEAIGKRDFQIEDVYAFEERLSLLYPGNRNVKPKIRQQLQFLSLTLANSCGVSECIFHSVPDMARNFYTVSARPGHERNLIVPDFAAHGRDRVAEGQDRFWIPCSGSRLELS